jgi:hypothetical protein
MRLELSEVLIINYNPDKVFKKQCCIDTSIDPELSAAMIKAHEIPSLLCLCRSLVAQEDIDELCMS